MPKTVSIYGTKVPTQYGLAPIRSVSRRWAAWLETGHGRRQDRPATAKKKNLVTPHQADQPALDLDPVGPENPRFISGIGRFQGNRIAFSPQPF